MNRDCLFCDKRLSNQQSMEKQLVNIHSSSLQFNKDFTNTNNRTFCPKRCKIHSSSRKHNCSFTKYHSSANLPSPIIPVISTLDINATLSINDCQPFDIDNFLAEMIPSSPRSAISVLNDFLSTTGLSILSAIPVQAIRVVADSFERTVNNGKPPLFL